MKRILTLWLPLVAVYWLARTLFDALAGRTPEPTLPSLVAVTVIPALQALALGWLTRSPGPSPTAALLRALRRSPLLWALLAIDLALPIVASRLPEQAWLVPGLGDAPDGNPASIAGSAQALLAALQFFRLAARWKVPTGGRKERAILISFGVALVVLGGLLAIDGLSLLGEVVLPAANPLLWKLCFHAPLLCAGLALLFAVEEIVAQRGESARASLAALGCATACAWIALLLSLLTSAVGDTQGLALEGTIGVIALLGTTALVAAGRWIERDSADRAGGAIGGAPAKHPPAGDV